MKMTPEEAREVLDLAVVQFRLFIWGLLKSVGLAK